VIVNSLHSWELAINPFNKSAMLTLTTVSSYAFTRCYLRTVLYVILGFGIGIGILILVPALEAFVSREIKNSDAIEMSTYIVPAP
jgi:hypothetical protein